MRLVYGKITLFLIILTAGNLQAQNDFSRVNEKIDTLLLKKDLGQAIKEAENSSANDARSLLLRLNLYYRAVNNEKIALTVKQITESANFEKNPHLVAESVKYAVKDALFKDAETLRIYLQKINFDGDIYYKFGELCVADRNACDANGFDEWLAQKAAETHEKDVSAYFDWTHRRIEWREKFAFNNAGILNQFAAAVRENPSNLETALRYLKFFRQPPEVVWLAETFASERAYDYYELGETLSNSTNYSRQSEDEKRQIRQIAAQFLQKSLNLPYKEQDKDLIKSRRFRYVSIPPRIGNYEKQLRFWTKSELAETFRNLNESQTAQPIVEELAALDKSDIVTENIHHLAGAVQADSGARAVESKILREQALRQNSYEYWQERISYYHGRKEPERIFDAYRQSFTAVPFNLNDENSHGNRLFFIRRFADFIEDEFGYYANEKAEELSDEQKQKLLLWKEAENLLRGEFEKTKSNLRYSYELAAIIEGKKFKKLLDEIFSRNAELIVSYAKINALNSNDHLLYYFLQSEFVSGTQKEAAINKIIKIAETSDAKNAWVICEVLTDSNETGKYAIRIVPILLKNLEKIEKHLNSAGVTEDERYDSESLRNKYLENLFKTFLAANDWKSAEKLILSKLNLSPSYSLWKLAENAAKNGVFSEAARFWKLKANLNRRDLNNLETLARYAEIKENLREFYRQMKLNESYSPIPDIALQKLR